ncbi:hypothetical protein [Acidovorax sp. A1169]|uniref:hypothetical protein n=1 Tax=Acidovorax sp. A1169 TaxID=3059524 RepID=UPI002737F214|nr:hypothetical protein [Acidovorax sp. A1169]MDP4076266.1 hypothetical protein [Acidovorax sp. A1169]
MAHIYSSIQQALSAHWAAHDKKYPQKVILTPDQHQALNDMRATVSTGQPSKGPKPLAGEKFMGVLIEHDINTPGVMIGVDGVETPLQQPAATA